MKKVLFRSIYTLIVVIVVGFFLQNSISETIETKIAKKIEIKINELRANGFSVTYNKAVNQTSQIEAYGQIEIVDCFKALQYIIKDQRYFGQILKNDDIISYDVYKNFFEGMIFEYDLSVNPINLSLDLNLYLVKFSNKIMENMSSLIVDKLNNRDFHIHIDENYNFEVKDINITNPKEQLTLAIIGMSGKIGEKYLLENLKIKELNVDDKESLLNFQELYVDENLFELSRLKFNTKTDYEDITFKLQNWKSVFSREIKDGLLYSNIKTNLASISLMNTSTTFDLDKASFEFILDKFPIQKYEELAYTTSGENYTAMLKEFLKEVSKDPSRIKIDINLEHLNSFKEDWSFQELDLKSNIIFSKSLANMKFYNIYDILQTFTLDLNVDKQSVANVEEMMGLGNTAFIDSENEEFKTLKVELKEEGIFVNGSLVLPKMMLQIPKIELE